MRVAFLIPIPFLVIYSCLGSYWFGVKEGLRRCSEDREPASVGPTDE